MAFVVIAEFQVSAENRAELLELCTFDSERSVADEVGCSQFDVIAGEEMPELIGLYEVYDDRAAFDTHLTMPHFKVFADGLERLQVVKVQVRFFLRQYP